MKLREQLNEQQLDAMLITNPINRRYTTGFTGSAGVALVTKSAAYLFTDFRYVEQATEQAQQFTIIQHGQLIEQEINSQLNELQVSKVGFEQNHLTYAVYQRYQSVFDVELVPVSDFVEKLRVIKTAEEITILKKAAEIADEAFLHIQSFIKPGVREIDIANELEFFMRRQGATSSSFDIIVASGKRSALPHGVASDKKIASGELVTLDYGALYDGYCSDITRTVAVGEVSPELKSIYDVVLTAQKHAVDEIRPDMTGKEADTLTRNYIEQKGYGQYFGHSTGHGLGMEVHEQPSLSQLSNTKLVSGMIVTVEPGIYIPDVGGCRIEDDIVITETGNERLTKVTKAFIQL